MYFPSELSDPTYWVLFAVIAFLFLLTFVGVWKKIGQSLDTRADGIRNELDEARRLREEAQALLASYQRKAKEAEAQADDIVAQARRDAEAMAAESRRELAARLERRARAAEAKIEAAEAQALGEVKARAAELAVEMTEDMLRNNLTAADKTRLFKDGLAGLGRLN